ncbi:pyrroline-5-carboxylate reductase [Clostridium polynesiense]|uniref:pyrroline-5-carboxylate reductase n=1 Tax=Clostridium polynesiense TaxID=1325933 RepID=UPI00058E5B32
MKIAFIGSGNMGGAMIGGMIKSGKVSPKDITATAKSRETLIKIKKDMGVNTELSNIEAVKQSDIIVLAVKPYVYDEVLMEIKDYLKDKILITIAAGKSISQIEAVAGEDIKLLRTMPNTPALVGEGITALCPNKNIDDKELDVLQDILQSFGKTEIIEENQMDAFIGICGSSPAYVFMFIEALADAGVKEGLPRAKAYKLASQAVLGSAKMVLDSGRHPGELKDMVCSPKGTTIEAVAALEEFGFRNSVIKAVERCSEKSRSM